MRTVIAGGSGFLGRALSSALLAAGHQVQILTRRPAHHGATSGTLAAEHVAWTPDGTLGPWAASCAGADAVINLAGESIAGPRWSLRRKALLYASRLQPTRTLVRFIEQASPRPAAFVSSSAIGYYGNRGDEVLTEDSQGGDGFLSELSFEWEFEAMKARSPATRVVVVRTGIVLDPEAGALAKLLPPFRLFAGGRFGSGRQFMSWIHRDDWVSLMAWVLGNARVNGPINATSPNPVINAEFARTLGRTIGRPALFPTPAFALKLALGEMAGPLLLDSQRVVPARAQAGGFTFAFPQLDAALADLLR